MHDSLRTDKTLQRPGQADAQLMRRITSLELLGVRGEIVIEHQGREYRLRVTQNGKLILTA